MVALSYPRRDSCRGVQKLRSTSTNCLEWRCDRLGTISSAIADVIPAARQRGTDERSWPKGAIRSARQMATGPSNLHGNCTFCNSVTRSQNHMASGSIRMHSATAAPLKKHNQRRSPSLGFRKIQIHTTIAKSRWLQPSANDIPSTGQPAKARNPMGSKKTGSDTQNGWSNLNIPPLHGPGRHTDAPIALESI